MQWKTLRWTLPAAAAAIVLAVGLWPGRDGRSSGQAYAFSNVPDALVGKAHYLHIQGTRTMHLGWSSAGSTSEAKQMPIDDWYDLKTGARRCVTSVGSMSRSFRQVISSNQPKEQIVFSPATGEMTTLITVCDGQYEMTLDPAKKTAVFMRLSPVMQRLTVAQAGNTALQQLFGDPYYLSGFTLLKKETLNGLACEVWQNETQLPPEGKVSKLTQCWFAPKTGQVIRVQEWTRMPPSTEYAESMLVDKIERDVTPPAGTFETTAPADYTFTTAKEGAPVRELGATGLGLSLARDGGPKGMLRTHACFVLPDGSVILGSSSRGDMSISVPISLPAGKVTPEQVQEFIENAKKNGGVVIPQSSSGAPGGSEHKKMVAVAGQPPAGTLIPLPSVGMPMPPAVPQDDLFANLTSGGDMPKTPVEAYGLKAVNAQGLTYAGRHLAWTKKKGEYIEWALYVPDGPAPAAVLGFNLLTRLNPAPPQNMKTVISVTTPAPVPVTAGSFNDLVAAAMAELSDGGAVPAGVDFDSVTQLAQQIRSSLARR